MNYDHVAEWSPVTIDGYVLCAKCKEPLRYRRTRKGAKLVHTPKGKVKSS